MWSSEKKRDLNNRKVKERLFPVGETVWSNMLKGPGKEFEGGRGHRAWSYSCGNSLGFLLYKRDPTE